MHETAAEQTPDEPKPFGDLEIIGRLQEKHLNAVGSLAFRFEFTTFDLVHCGFDSNRDKIV